MCWALSVSSFEFGGNFMKNINYFKVFLVSLILCCIGNSAFSQTLWQNTQCGMTVAQIKRLYPSAVPIINANRVMSHADEGLKCNNFIEIANEIFDVSFFFKANSLIQVKLTCKEAALKLWGRYVFDELNTALIVQYGRPYKYLKDEEYSKVWHSYFLSGRTQIILSYSTDQRSDLDIYYQASATSGKL
jgi:hypothetical protein